MNHRDSHDEPFHERKTGLVNVILHGLFCMEYQEVRDRIILEIKAPEIWDHHFVGGTRGNLILLDGEEIDWTNVGLLGSRPKPPRYKSTVPSDIPLTVPQFSRAQTEVGNTRDDCTKGKLLLPWPARFFCKRLGEFPPFQSRTGRPPEKSVGKNIFDFCYREGNDSLGVTTGMTFQHAWTMPYLPDWIPTMNFHFFFQPYFVHTYIKDVNRDLAEASKIFENEENFDLMIAPDANPASVNPLGTGDNVPGTATEDELALAEPIVTPSATPKELRKILQMLDLLSLLQVQPSVNMRDTSAEKPTKKSKTVVRESPAERKKEAARNFDVGMVLISNANCPTFFVGQ